MWTLIIILLLLALLGGGAGYSRWGYGGFSPLAVILIIAIVLYFTGNLRLR